MPVFRSSNAEHLALFQAFLDSKRDNPALAGQEARRLLPYLSATARQLQEDLAGTKRALRRDKRLKRLTKPQKLRRVFEAAGKRTGNTILSEIVVMPQELHRKAQQLPGNKSFASSSQYGNCGYTLGFLQIFNNGETQGSVSIPLFAFDDGMMLRVAVHKPEVMLRAFAEVMTCGNHDMLHHYTNETLNTDIAQRFTQNSQLPYREKFGVNEWSKRTFGFSGDSSPKSYESWLMLNHRRMRRQMEETAEGISLWESCTRFFDELERIGKNVESDFGPISAHNVVDYFGTMLCFSLMRFLPLDHPLMDYAIDRLEKADPDTGLVLDKREQVLEGAKNDSNIHGALSNYDARGANLMPHNNASADYRAIKRAQVMLLAPWVAHLLSPAQHSTSLEQMQERVGRVNLDMFSAADFGGRRFIPDGMQEIKWADGGSTRAHYKEGKLHNEGASAVTEISADGSRHDRWYRDGIMYNDAGPAWVTKRPDGYSEEKWYDEDGNLHRKYGPAHVRSDPNGEREEVWYSRGEKQRDDGPARVFHTSDGMTIEEWYSVNSLHREDGPAYVEEGADGRIKEAWYRYGKQHRVGGPACVEKFSDGVYVEKWMQDDLLHRRDGPAMILKNPNGFYCEEWSVNGQFHRLDGPAYIEVLPGQTRTERYYVNGCLHREDGPAEIVIYIDGTRDERWYKNGRRIYAPGTENDKSPPDLKITSTMNIFFTGNSEVADFFKPESMKKFAEAFAKENDRKPFFGLGPSEERKKAEFLKEFAGALKAKKPGWKLPDPKI